jgi:2',3'-cyclic-nucleotide 2'-phosphodiesterase (5'-nucleotidase family)
MSTSLPPIDNSLLPADIRSGSQSDQDNYKAGLQFERQLVEQLTQTMADSNKAMQGADDSSDGDDSSSQGSDAVTDSYNQQLPGIMADAIMQNGGLGLARTIANNLKGSQS